MILRVEHVGIAVADVAAANALFTRLLGRAPYKEQTVEREAVITSFFQVGETKLELVAATTPESTIAKYVAKRGEGMHHIALEVTDIRAEMSRLEAEGFELLSPEPKAGADGKIICFLHPKSTGGVLVELCQSV